jgi:hypothetical protein
MPFYNQQGRVRRDGAVTVTPRALQPYLSATTTTTSNYATTGTSTTATAESASVQKQRAVTASTSSEPLVLPIRPVRAHSASSGTSSSAVRPVSASSRLLLQRIGKHLGCELSGVMALLQQQQQQQQQKQQQQQQEQQKSSCNTGTVNAEFNVLKFARTASQLLLTQNQQQQQQQELSQQVQAEAVQAVEVKNKGDVPVADVAHSTVQKKPLTR